MAKRSDYYFSTSPLRGVGSLYFLKVLQEAPPDSAVRKLLGSYVREGDRDLGLTQYPIPEHASLPGYFLTIFGQNPANAGIDPVLTIDLAGVSQELKLDKGFSAGFKSPFPGAPFSGGIDLDYSKVSRIVMNLGTGAQKRYIPRDLISDEYKTNIAEHSDQFRPVVFHDDRMLVDQILLVKNLSVEIESTTTFTADFNAKADAVNGLDVGLKYHKTSESKYKLEVAGDREYLFGLAAIQADKFAN